MQGINRAKHVHLIDALLHLENLLCQDFDGNTRQQALAFRKELEFMFTNYDMQIAGLAELIEEYEELFQKAKVQFLSPKLKELRKQVTPDTRTFSILSENIRLVYGT